MQRDDERLNTALVTGACSGIGRALASELAALGYDLVLVSDRPSALSAFAESLQSTHDISVHPVALDLARAEAADELNALLDERGLQIDILINNAGMFFFGEVVDTEADKISALLQLHVVTPTLLARHLGEKMRQRRRGHLLFVSSISAWNDFPGIALYASSKRYQRSFAAALRSELKVWGVNVTVVAPGATATRLYQAPPNTLKWATRLGVMRAPEPVARAALAAMFAGQALVVPGWSAKLSAGLMAISPRWAIDLVRRRTSLLPRP